MELLGPLGFSPASPDTDLARSVGLPPEILIHIFSIISHTPKSQSTLRSCTLVSRLWYPPAVQALYDRPVIKSRNFDLFVNTLCPSINHNVKKNGLADMVKRLDMSMLTDDKSHSKSQTPRLLRRCKETLEEFVASPTPLRYTSTVQTPMWQSHLQSHSIDSFAALSKCTNLCRLDLSFIAYSLDLDLFLNSIKNLDRLKCLHYPPSCRLNTNKSLNPPPPWPMNLLEVHIPGNFCKDNLDFISNFPPSLTHLVIQRGSPLIESVVRFLLQKLGTQLESLEIIPQMTLLAGDFLDEVLVFSPVLRRLSLPAKYISVKFFTYPDPSNPTSKDLFPLVELELTCGIYGDESVEINCNHVWDAVVDGRLGRLRRLKVHRGLDWNVGREARSDLKALDDMLQTLALEDAEASCSHETIDAGVWIFGSSLESSEPD